MSKQPEKYLTCFAGPNGSGKTTITRGILQTSFDFGELINADTIAENLAKSKSEETPSAETQWEAAVAAEDLRWKLLQDGVSFCTETVMSDADRWIRFFTAAKQNGYFIHLIFVTTSDPEINVQRVADRVTKGGHNVDHTKIIARYHRVMNEVLPRVLPLVDQAILYDNSAFAGGGRRVAVFDGKQLQATCPLPELPAWVQQLAKHLSH